MSASAFFRRLTEQTLAAAGYRMERIDKPFYRNQEKLGQLILEDQRRHAGKEFFFVQVGACDGVSFDGLYEFVIRNQLKGIVIEPLPDLYEELKTNYAKLPLVVPLNIALHRTAKELDMYRVATGVEGVPEWAKGSSSLDPDHLKRANIRPDAIISQKVKCISWKELIDQNKIRRIDYLQIDTEGYDYEIMSMLDFAAVRPAVIKFEHNVGSGTMSIEQLKDCVRMLLEQKYHVLTMACDVIAYSRIDVFPKELLEQA
jgi:FkbM family methyltransferase